LEGESRPRQTKAKTRKSQRDVYSDEEEEMYGRRGGPEDRYDMEDDFLVEDEDLEEGSDEDAEGEDDDDIDVVIEKQEKADRGDKRASPKRSRAEDDAAPDASPVSRHKRRRVISDDEDE
jgi:hypothetical protein